MAFGKGTPSTSKPGAKAEALRNTPTRFDARGMRAPLVLADGVTRERVSEECREAALAFMDGVARGWDKLELALWLTGPYARATRHLPREDASRVPTRGGSEPGAGAEPRAIRNESIENLVIRVRGQLLAALEKAALELGSLEFVGEMVERGHVRKVVDAEGRDAWVPVDSPRMRLRDRVRSLFVADYLDAPHTYASLFVCHRCEAVVFDDHAKRRNVCGAHRMSGLAPRDEESEESPLPVAQGPRRS
jgi:hypothetical protein